MVELACLPKEATFPKSTVKIAVAIPCYNTQNTIRDVVLKTKKYVDEVIVIDDGSKDLTAIIARAAGAVIISHEKNQGKGAAIKTALNNISADIIVFIDGDGQHDPRDIPKLIEPILKNNADFVIGSRYLASSKIYSTPFRRKFANTVASFIISIIISFLQPAAYFINSKLFRKKTRKITNTTQTQKSAIKGNDIKLIDGKFKWISDCTSGFTALKMKNCGNLALISDGFQIEAEMIFEQAKNGLVIAEIPISCDWEGYSSNLSIIKDGFKTITLLIEKLINYA
jgi:glycosyltransferase involved in cell wall biosynthesis